MKTKEEIVAWLKSNSQVRVILLEVTGVLVDNVPTNFYISNRPFISAGSDVPPNTSYENTISGGVTFNESIDLAGGNPTIGYGDIELDNTGGRLDAWLNYVWVNKPVAIYIGDITWPKSDFFRIFKGLVRDIDSSGRNSINLMLVNILQSLNTSISDTILLNETANKDQLIPLTYGECFNVTPLLVDPPNLVYQVHTGKIQDILEVRDNGAPVNVSKDLESGKFTLVNSPYGTITASVQGNHYYGTEYSSNLGKVIEDILFPVIGVAAEVILKIVTTAANQTFGFTFQGDRVGGVAINWGDGATSINTSNVTVSHTFATAGTYLVRLAGTRYGFKVASGMSYLDDVLQWGGAQFSSLNSTFENWTKSGWTATDIPDVSACADMTGIFRNAANFNYDISGWNTVGVTNMTEMFRGAASFNQNIGGWDVSGVVNMSGMFYGATVFNQDIGGWDVEVVQNMTDMFRNASAFNQDLSDWCVVGVLTEPSGFESGAVSWMPSNKLFNRPLWSLCANPVEFELPVVVGGNNFAFGVFRDIILPVNLNVLPFGAITDFTVPVELNVLPFGVVADTTLPVVLSAPPQFAAVATFTLPINLSNT